MHHSASGLTCNYRSASYGYSRTISVLTCTLISSLSLDFTVKMQEANAQSIVSIAYLFQWPISTVKRWTRHGCIDQTPQLREIAHFDLPQAPSIAFRNWLSCESTRSELESKVKRLEDRVPKVEAETS